jgi:hypothetical protein
MTNPSDGYPSPMPTTYDGNGSTGDTAKAEAANVGQTAKEAGGQVASTATEQAKNVADETKRQAKDLLNQAQSQVQEQAGTQKDKAASGLRSLADELRSMTEGNPLQNGTTTDLVRQASDKAHELASWIEQRDPGTLLDEVRQLARRKPGMFLLGAALAGVAAGRLTRGVVAASSSDNAAVGASGNSAAGAYGNTAVAVNTGTSYQTTTASTTAAYGSPYADDLTPDTSPLVVEPERARQSAAGLGTDEERL